MARRSGDRAALAYTLNARCIAVWTPDTVAERLEAAGEIMRLADDAGDRDLALRGHMRRLGALLELGDLRTADRELAEYAQRARALRQPSHLWFLATDFSSSYGMAVGVGAIIQPGAGARHHSVGVSTRSSRAAYFPASMRSEGPAPPGPSRPPEPKWPLPGT